MADVADPCPGSLGRGPHGQRVTRGGHAAGSKSFFNVEICGSTPGILVAGSAARDKCYALLRLPQIFVFKIK